jgi:hypothetical protein
MQVRVPTCVGFREPARFAGRDSKEWDADMIATLVREALEENQVRVGAAEYLGYQEVRRPGRAPYAQVRMTGLSSRRSPRAPRTRTAAACTGGC